MARGKPSNCAITPTAVQPPAKRRTNFQALKRADALQRKAFDEWSRLHGMVILLFSDVEFVTTTLHAQLLPTENGRFDFTTAAALTFGERVNAIKRALRLKDAHKKWKPLVKKASSLAHRRNIFAHNPVYYDPSKKSYVLHLLREPGATRDIADLKKLEDDLHALVCQMHVELFNLMQTPTMLAIALSRFHGK